MFEQRRTTIRFRELMDQGKIVLVNLAKGRLSEFNARFLGMVLMSKIQMAAMSRVDTPREQRRPFYLYVDEFQSIATESFVSLLSEARKFGLSLVLTNQFVSQINNERIMKSVFGNVGTLIAMRVGREDASVLAPQFAPSFDELDLIILPNWQAVVKTKCQGQVMQPFSMNKLRPAAVGNPSDPRELRKQSRRRYGRF